MLNKLRFKHVNINSILEREKSSNPLDDFGSDGGIDPPQNSPPGPSSFFLSPITSNESASTTIVEQDHIDEPKLPDSYSPLLSLPVEILHRIIELVYYDDNTNSINANLETFSKTIPLLSKTVNALSLRFLYKYAVFNRPHSFDKFLHNLIRHPDLGRYVEFIDFQTFTSIGLGRTGRMNQEIQMVTSETIAHALTLIPNLIEFLASENIQDDLGVAVLDNLFNHQPKLQALDFCGASSESFARAFQLLEIELPQTEIIAGQVVERRKLENLFKISFHDCSNLHVDIFAKILPHLQNLRRLDLTHTSINSTTLVANVPVTSRLTHLSLARCSRLTTKDLINFLVNHPSVAHHSLRWLNLQIDSNVVSPLSDVYLHYTLQNLKADDLRYLNLGGLPVNTRILRTIRKRFVNLESLILSHSGLETADIMEYLEGNTTIKFLDLTGCKKITRFNLTSILKANFGSSLLALEYDFKPLMEMTGGDYSKIAPATSSLSLVDQSMVQPDIWKFYDNEGRRAWIYKVGQNDPAYKSILAGNYNSYKLSSSLTFYDLETGKKITQKTTKPDFLRYASRKINCSIGYYQLNDCKKKSYIKNDGDYQEDIWPVAFSQRGIYNYYSLNVK
ncbi:hypothetical protein PGUG_03462 [Meyerozyma guilliermondii ATCC 6260]|uniref:F-box domain-containing protein n=1 Tax=Meyerozyma guilliermondii (strain ATCC 6260 / CBS 566 / DSM 6381 / JCM 1539 / NBRC 10279 / NRRL Y-324) TaxID=294746 RepID=A5DJL1_PICGU|nr:uncharacterized protein PGUG_03462 [Meyerozyma guilliermondii ATCC 6260]EDK39364.2 hypothetical protein PGUG_03462 [Meyerozyma guilliermondii ATCC 6260]